MGILFKQGDMQMSIQPNFGYIGNSVDRAVSKTENNVTTTAKLGMIGAGTLGAGFVVANKDSFVKLAKENEIIGKPANFVATHLGKAKNFLKGKYEVAFSKALDKTADWANKNPEKAMTAFKNGQKIGAKLGKFAKVLKSIPGPVKAFAAIAAGVVMLGAAKKEGRIEQKFEDANALNK